MTMHNYSNVQFEINIDVTNMTWNEGDEPGTGGQNEINFENI